MGALYPVVSEGRDYLCARCGDVLPEGAHVSHGEQDGEIAWVTALNGDGDRIHACGEVPGG